MEEKDNNTKNRVLKKQSEIKQEPDLLEILKEIPQDKREVVLKSLMISESHSGPLPSPKTLAKYNEIIPNGAERIMQMAENQSAHRIEMEKLVISKQTNQSGRGQNYGLVIAILALILTGLLAYLGHDAVAGIVGGTTVIGLVSIFVIAKKKQEANLEDKKVDLEQD